MLKSTFPLKQFLNNFNINIIKFTSFNYCNKSSQKEKLENILSNRKYDPEQFPKVTNLNTVREKYEDKLQSKPAKGARIGNVKSDGTTKRWYKNSTIKLDFNQKNEREWKIYLDNIPILTPKENVLYSPSYPLSLAVAAEWQRQDKEIKPNTMPLMTLCTTSIDRLSETRQIVVGGLLKYLETDTICFEADKKKDPELYKAHQRLHVPLRDWFSNTFHVGLKVTPNGSLFSPQQSYETINVLRWYLHGLDDWQLAGLDAMAAMTKSLIVPLASMRGKTTIDDAIFASRAEEVIQEQRCGRINAGHDLEEIDIKVKYSAAVYFMHSLPYKI